MSKIGQQISELRKNTPRATQWLLIFVAIVIVVVLLILLLGKRAHRTDVPDVAAVAPQFTILSDTNIDLTGTAIDETRTAEIQLNATDDIKVQQISFEPEDADAPLPAGLGEKNTCIADNIVVNNDSPCTITLEYTPRTAQTNTAVIVRVTGIAPSTETEVVSGDEIRVVVGTKEAQVTKPGTTTEISTPEPKDEVDIPEVDDAPVEDTEDTTTADIVEEEEDTFEDIKPDINFGKPDEPINTSFDSAVSNVSDALTRPLSNACSDFAFPGYNTAGIQSGWIRPEGGTYKYHPFSDVDCNHATGIYNPDTGFIMDINNRTKKIGSDAEHVRFGVNMGNINLPSFEGAGVSANWDVSAEYDALDALSSDKEIKFVFEKKDSDEIKNKFLGSTNDDEAVFSTQPYDRRFILRQYKPIPATIVSDVQADTKLLESGLPVRATVDRNVYSDNGRTIILPTGTLMLGYVTGELPGPYKAVGRMQIKWYQFIRPDGVEFNFTCDNDTDCPFAADSQGRKGVPGHGSTDYIQQFFMPMLTAIVPAAVNLIAPISDSFVNQIDLDNNTVVQSGTVRSSELAKNEIIKTWNNVATKLLVDTMDNTTPPFSIAAGTRITVFSPQDLVVNCTGEGKQCNLAAAKKANPRKTKVAHDATMTTNKDELIGQVRSMLSETLFSDWCVDAEDKSGAKYANPDKESEIVERGYTFATVDFYCRSFGTYQAINNAKQAAVFENQKDSSNKNSVASTGGPGNKEYNEQILGLKYNEDNSIKNPFQKEKEPVPASAVQQQPSGIITCGDGSNPDANGCCPGETYTDMGEDGFNCCPDTGGDCFPPIAF